MMREVGGNNAIWILAPCRMGWILLLLKSRASGRWQKQMQSFPYDWMSLCRRYSLYKKLFPCKLAHFRNAFLTSMVSGRFPTGINTTFKKSRRKVPVGMVFRLTQDLPSQIRELLVAYKVLILYSRTSCCTSRVSLTIVVTPDAFNRENRILRKSMGSHISKLVIVISDINTPADNPSGMKAS